MTLCVKCCVGFRQPSKYVTLVRVICPANESSIAGDLAFQVQFGLYSQDQQEAIMDVLVSIFCYKHSKVRRRSSKCYTRGYTLYCPLPLAVWGSLNPYFFAVSGLHHQSTPPRDYDIHLLEDHWRLTRRGKSTNVSRRLLVFVYSAQSPPFPHSPSCHLSNHQSGRSSVARFSKLFSTSHGHFMPVEAWERRGSW